MKSLSILFLSLILIFYACSDKSNEVNTELVKPQLPAQLGYSPAQIKYWYSTANDLDKAYTLIEETDSTLKYEMVTITRVYMIQDNKCIRIGDIRIAINNEMSQGLIKNIYRDLKEFGFSDAKMNGDITVINHSSIPNLKAMYSQQMNEDRTNLINIVMYDKE